jgi:hypothetical protein
METQKHWDDIYETKGTRDVSWFAPHLEKSLKLIESASPGKDAHVIDVGGGASTLVDDLLAFGYKNLTVLDISKTALEKIKERLGHRGDLVT